MQPAADHTNHFLSAAMRLVRSGRPLQPRALTHEVRVEQVPGGTHAMVWFATAGCSWDACTMCDYGKGRRIGMAQVFTGFREGLLALGDQKIQYLLVSPSGSMFDAAEVPARVRRDMFAALAEFPAPHLLFETRAETVTDEVVGELNENLGHKKLGVMMGVESGSPWVQRYCLNKGSHPSSFLAAVARLRGGGITAIGNVSLGIPFLSEAEALEHAVRTARWVLEQTELAVILPVHVKPYTLAAELYQLGLYQPPSLWSLAEALYQLGAQRCSQVTISWYRNFSGEPLVSSPDTCPACRDEALGILDSYRANPTFAAVEKLRNLGCPCREVWQSGLRRPSHPLGQRVWFAYQQLAERLGLQDELADRAAGLRCDLFGEDALGCFTTE